MITVNRTVSAPGQLPMRDLGECQAANALQGARRRRTAVPRSPRRRLMKRRNQIKNAFRVTKKRRRIPPVTCFCDLSKPLGLVWDTTRVYKLVKFSRCSTKVG
jgi:hypothetical protein